MASPNTRKRVEDITIDDLEAYPLWEHALDEECMDGQDEQTVRPVLLLGDGIPLLESFEWFLVAADFEDPQSDGYRGYLYLSAKGRRRIKIESGALLGSFGTLALPTVSRAVAKKRDYPWAIECREHLCSALGKKERQLFPLIYNLSLRIEGEKEKRRGKIT